MDPQGAMGGQVQAADDPGQGQEGGIPMSGAAQPAAATPAQRMQNAGNLVQMLLMHGMKKHNLMGPDGKPTKVGSYARGGLVRSFSLGGSVDIDDDDQPPDRSFEDANRVRGDDEYYAPLHKGYDTPLNRGNDTTPALQGGGRNGYKANKLTRSFAEGGPIDDDAETTQTPAGPEEGDQGAGAIPSGGDPAQTSAISNQGPSSVASTGSRTPSVMQYVTGADAPPDAVMDQLHTSFKKGGKSGNEAALGTVAAAAEKSPDLGFSVVQGYRKRYDKNRAAAAQALDMGNLDGGATALNEAFNNLPTAETANFSHDGQNITASVDGQSYKMSPQLASGLLAKGVGGHFDNMIFTGVKQPFQTIAATTNAALSMSAGNPRQPGQMAPAPAAQPAQGTQVAANAQQPRSNFLSDAEIAQTPEHQRENFEQWKIANHPELYQKGTGGGDAGWNSIEKVMRQNGATEDQIDAAFQSNRARQGQIRGGQPAPAAAPTQSSAPNGQWVYPGGDRNKAPVWRASPAPSAAQTPPAR